MEEHLATLHHSLGAVDEGEGHGSGEARLALRLGPIDDRVVRLLLCRPKRSEPRMHDDIARLEAVVATLEMRLPDEIDDIDVVQRADDSLEQRSLSASPGGNSATIEASHPPTFLKRIRANP
jgi:hypothetical protein